MTLRWLLAVAGLLCFATGARAQVGLYFNPLVTHVSLAQQDSGSFAFLGQNDTSRLFGGVSLGGYYGLSKDPKLDFAIDVRDEIEHGGSALLNSFLFGARVSTKRNAFNPYAQLSGGVGTTHSPLSPARINKGEFKVYGGADYSVSHHLDIRIVEVGYGSLTTVSSAQFGGLTPISAAKMISFSSGLVFRIR